MIRTFVSTVATFAAVASLPGFIQTESPKFSSRVDVVRVDALVMERGRPVTGLRVEDFEIWDNGVPQRIASASFEQIPLCVVLALDVSGSVSGERLSHLSRAAGSVVDGLVKNDKVGLLTFNQEVSVHSMPAEDFIRTRAAFRDLQTGGDTSLVDASYSAMVLSEAEQGRPLAIVFSDGADTASFLQAEDVLETARRTDSVVYGAVYGGSGGGAFLRDLSEVTGGRVLRIASTDELSATFAGILNEFRQRYLLSYSPAAVAGAGWHRIEVRVKDRRLAIQARRGYFALR
jgi:Ca-activated chloride channel family protein